MMYDFEIMLRGYDMKKIYIPADEATFTKEFLLLSTNNEVIATFDRSLVVYVIRH